MAHFKEQAGTPYDWNEGGVYVIEREDPVDGGLDGVSNRQGRELTHRTRDLHERQSKSEAETPIAIETAKNVAVGLAKGYTDQTAAAVRDELALGDQAAVNTAKAYADRIVAALVDNSPEMLNTLEELAGALGNNPNFATDVLQAIGERATKSEVNTALAGKAPKEGNKNQVFAASYFQDNQELYDPSWPLAGIGYCGSEAGGKTHRHCSPAWFKAQLGLWHSGNFNPATKADKSYVDTALGGKADLTAVVSRSDNFENAAETFTSNGITIGDALGLAANLYYDYHTMGVAGVRALQLIHQVTGGYGRFYIRSTSYWGSTYGAIYELYYSGNLDKAKLDTLPAKIIRGAVDASGYSTKHNADGVRPDGTELVKVIHNLGHTNYTAVATVVANRDNANRDNVVVVYQKGDNDVWFLVTNGENKSDEKTAFDFMIIPL